MRQARGKSPAYLARLPREALPQSAARLPVGPGDRWGGVSPRDSRKAERKIPLWNVGDVRAPTAGASPAALRSPLPPLAPLLVKILHIHPPPQHVDPSGPGPRPLEGRVGAYRDGAMQDRASELPRIGLPRTSVNKTTEGPGRSSPSPSIPSREDREDTRVHKVGFWFRRGHQSGGKRRQPRGRRF